VDEKEVKKEAEIQEESVQEAVEIQAETVEEEKAAKSQESAEEIPAEETNVKRLRGSRGPKGARRRKIETVEPVESEWKEQVVQIRRVTKVVKGGKKLSFRAIVIVGNKKGQVGMGVAKAAEVIIAIQKAVADGRKNLVTVPLFKTTIPHQITGKSGAGSVVLKPASQGTGVIAGGAVRAVLELAGVENILSKSLGSKSALNAANATLNALKALRPFSDVARIRNISVKQMLGNKN
jgi:small subunit ribosomal protein S5